MGSLRFASKVLKPFFYSRFSRTEWMTRRAISTGQDLVMFGNIQGKKSRQSDVGEEVLDDFLGRWVQEYTMLTSAEGEVTGPIIHGKSYYDLFKKPTIFYEKRGHKWKVRTGFEPKGYNVFYSFKLGKDFLMQYPDNGLYRVLVFQDDHYMKWAFQPYYYKPHDLPKLEEAIYQVTEVKEGKLLWKTEYPDKSTTVRTYIKA